MKKGLILLWLTVWIAAACASTGSSNPYRGTDSMINLANTCATCGATIRDDYFAGSAFRAMGPGSY